MPHLWRPDLEHLSMGDLYKMLPPPMQKGVDRVVWEKQVKLPEMGLNVEDKYYFSKEDILWLFDPKPEIFIPEYLNLSDDQKQLFLYGYDPVSWVRTFLKYEPRIYQQLFLRASTKYTRIGLRWGRRSGKTISLMWKMMHYPLSNPGSRVIVITPYESQVNLFYSELWNMLAHSGIKTTEEIREAFLIDRSIRKPIEIYFKNGSVIRMFTSGARSGGNADTVRGQEADLLLLDELAYFGDNDLSSIMPMLQDTSEEKTYEKVLLASSTPKGRSDSFYQLVDPERPNNQVKEYWFSSFANPLFNKKKEEESRLEAKTKTAFEQEYLAHWGDMTVGVFRPIILDLASRSYYYTGRKLEQDDRVILGMDWDKYGAGVNLCIVEQLGVWAGEDVGKYQVIQRYELERGSVKDLLGAGVREAINLDSIYGFDYIYVDRGYGERQWEELVEALGSKVVGVNYSSSVEELDPVAGIITKEPLKPFAVDNAASIFERGNLIISKEDSVLREQMLAYSKIKTSASGKPIFGSTNPTTIPDHAIDALCFALLGFKQKFGDLIPRTKFLAPVALNSNSFMLDPSLNDKRMVYDEADESDSRKFTIRTESTSLWGRKRNSKFKRSGW